jgi:hypothetical protein
VVPREDAPALAAAIVARLRTGGRTGPSTQATIEARFRADALARQYWNLYAEIRHS